MIEFLMDLIQKAGAICKAEQSRVLPSDVNFKNRKDLVTAVDKRIENFIIEKIRIRYPAHDILGEETGRSGFSSDYVWIIDPIDGTTSFLHQQPFYSISIAVQHQGQTVCSAVFAPRLDELFYADQDSGAFLNGKKTSTSCPSFVNSSE